MSTEPRWPDLPPPLPWLLYDGVATAGRNEATIEGTARVWFTVRDKPTVRFDFTAEGDAGYLGLMNDSGLSVRDGLSTVLVAGDEGAQSSGWSHNGFRTCGDAANLSGGNGSLIDVLRFHLVNFGEDDRGVRLFNVDEWTVRIAPTGSPPRLNDFAITHVLDLVRADGSEFSVDDAIPARRWLFDALTFAAGRVVGFALAQGYHQGAAVFIEGKCTKVDPWKTRRSWWDQRCLGDEDLAELCSRWAEAAGDERTGSLLRRAASSYATALTPEPLDSAVPIAGIGVELMVWELIHQRDRLLSTDEFDRLSLASRLRLTLRIVGVPSGLPADCAGLHAHVAGAELADGPYAFADVRNRLVHPPRKTRGWPSRDVMTEAWYLGLEYLALLVLAVLSYDGRYRSQFKWSGYTGTEVPVPWRKPGSETI